MTAATVWDVEQTPSVRIAGRRRGHLTLVESATVAGRARSGGQMRITRRGRLALTLSVAVAVVALVFAAVSAFAGGSADRVVTVEPGMTLTQIAETHMGGVPVSEAVVDLRLANGLSSSSLTPGQTLVIPE